MANAPRTASSPVLLGAVAAAVHLGFDFLASRSAWTTPPYLLLSFMDEAFRDFLNPVGVSIGAAFGLAAMTTAIALAAEWVPRRRAAVLGSALSALWVFSGGVMLAVYVRPPWGVAIGSLAAGLPRMWAIAWILDRVMPRPSPAPAKGA